MSDVPVTQWDKENGTAYVGLAPGKITKTRRWLSAEVIIDFDAADNVLGVEVIGLPKPGEIIE